jgi:hypothetical protein
MHLIQLYLWGTVASNHPLMKHQVSKFLQVCNTFRIHQFWVRNSDMVDCLHNSSNSLATLPRLAFKSLLQDCAFPAALGTGPVFTKRGASCHAKSRGLSCSKWSNGMFQLQKSHYLRFNLRWKICRLELQLVEIWMKNSWVLGKITFFQLGCDCD